MKKLIVTRADNNIQNWKNLIHPILKEYAKRCNADFLCIWNDVKDNSRAYAIMQLYDLFNKYDRILQIDTDCLILKHCPDIFDLVPYDEIGTIYEDVGSRQLHRRNLIKKIQDERQDVNWKSGYINTGVFITSKCHKEIFNPSEPLWMDFGYDDVELGYQIHKNNFKIYELPFTFNHMSMFSESWNLFASKFDSYIIHFAGNGFDNRISRFNQIYQEYLIFKKYNMVY